MTRLKQALAATALGMAAVMPGDAVADPKMSKVSERAEFERLVVGRDLTIFGIRVTVTPDGAIDGRAYGQPVKGAWRWRDGYFCRELSWGERDLGPNCQEVRVNGKTVRFTSDKGTGRYADLKMR